MAGAKTGTNPLLGHEFHHSSLENLDPSLPFAYRVERGHGIDGTHDGVLVHNLLASYAHLRSAAGSLWAPRFVAFVASVRAQAHRARGPAVQAGAAHASAALAAI